MPKSKRKRKSKKLAPKELTPKQLEARQKIRSKAARTAALARWSKDADRPLSKRALKQQTALIPTSQLTVEHYADRPNPELSWAAAILKRRASSKAQRHAAAQIFSKSANSGKSPWSKLPPEERSEIARRGGVRRWEIWREEKARLAGEKSAAQDN